MLVVDASSLIEVVTQGQRGPAIERRLAQDEDQFAPHVIDVEVFSTIRQRYLVGSLDRTRAELALQDLRNWRGQRIAHARLIGRAWELRNNVRGWDAMYVALAEAFGATLLTTDARLARAIGPRCAIEVAPA
jgi:predicted nucleic acid-binding protein